MQVALGHVVEDHGLGALLAPSLTERAEVAAALDVDADLELFVGHVPGPLANVGGEHAVDLRAGAKIADGVELVHEGGRAAYEVHFATTQAAHEFDPGAHAE